MAKMSDKTKRAINKGRRKAGLKPIKFGAKKKKGSKSKPVKTKKSKTKISRKAGLGMGMRAYQNVKKSGIGNW